jgi:membrane protein implicated in regulation of membrane protease activity
MMTDWMVWLALTGALVILEMFTGTFYLLMIGIGCAIGGLSAVFGASNALQFLSAAVTGIIAIYALRRSGLGRISRREAARDPNVILDIGQTLTVDSWSGEDGGTHTARVMYRGAMWDVELQHGSIAHSGTFAIREVRGSRLVVANSGSNNN